MKYLTIKVFFSGNSAVLLCSLADSHAHNTYISNFQRKIISKTIFVIYYFKFSHHQHQQYKK